MPYLAVDVRRSGKGRLLSATVSEISDDGAVAEPVFLANPPEEAGEAFPALDALIRDASADTVLVTWMGHLWLHRVGDAARNRYYQHVDLGASFIARHRHHVGLAAFGCVADATGSAGVAALLRQIVTHGRLVWATGGSSAVRAFWTHDFFTPLDRVVSVSAPEWVTEPVSLDIADISSSQGAV